MGVWRRLAALHPGREPEGETMDISQYIFSRPEGMVVAQDDSLDPDSTASNYPTVASVSTTRWGCPRPPGLPIAESSTAPLAIGQVFANKYTIQAQLGQGVTGTVCALGTAAFTAIGPSRQ